MKRLLPSLRAKKRYLAFELISEGPADRSDIVKEVISSASSLLGDVTTSDCNIKVLGFENGKGIIQCSHTRVKETRAALAALTRVNGKRATLHVLGASGTVKRATEKFLQDNKIFEPEVEPETEPKIESRMDLRVKTGIGTSGEYRKERIQDRFPEK